MNLANRVIRLALSNPKLRPHLLPVLRQHTATAPVQVLMPLAEMLAPQNPSGMSLALVQAFVWAISQTPLVKSGPGYRAEVSSFSVMEKSKVDIEMSAGTSSAQFDSYTGWSPPEPREVDGTLSFPKEVVYSQSEDVLFSEVWQYLRTKAATPVRDVISQTALNTFLRAVSGHRRIVADVVSNLLSQQVLQRDLKTELFELFDQTEEFHLAFEWPNSAIETDCEWQVLQTQVEVTEPSFTRKGIGFDVVFRVKIGLLEASATYDAPEPDYELYSDRERGWDYDDEDDLRSSLIRMAAMHEDLQPILLPLLKN